MTRALPRPDNAAWAPNSLPQEAFLGSGAYEALYGGAAGGGKSDALVAGALRHVHRPRYRGIIFRRHFTDLERYLVARTQAVYPHAGGVYRKGDHCWEFASGARIFLAHLRDDAAALAHKSSEYQYIAFDELTSFTSFQYTYMLSRGRTTDPELPIRIRAGTNPGDIGHEWVRRRWAPWLDTRPENDGPRARPGQTLRYLAGPPEEGDTYVAKGTPNALTRVFFPAFARDNPDLMTGDPGYVTRLEAQDRVTRLQLVEGDWTVKPGRGEYFQRTWWRYLDEAPPRSAWRRAVRAWDLAGSKKSDWTVGVLYVHVPTAIEPWVIVDVIRFRGTPGEVLRRVLATAEADGKDVEIFIPQDPGQAGKYQADDYVAKLAGYVVKTERPTGDKVTRAKPHSPQVEHGHVALVRASWNHVLVEEHQDLPEGDNDDVVDATSDGFNHLNGTPDRGDAVPPPSPDDTDARDLAAFAAR